MSKQLHHFSFTLFESHRYSKGKHDSSIPSSGEIKVAVTENLLYVEYWVKGKLYERRWDFKEESASFNSQGDLELRKIEKDGFYDSIPLWLPLRSGPREFFRASNKCETKADMCIEYPGQRRSRIAMKMRKIGDRYELTNTSQSGESSLSYVVNGAQISSIEYRSRSQTEPVTGQGAKEYRTVFKATALPPLKELNVPDWRAFAPVARRFTYDFFKMKYDESNGTIENQYRVARQIKDNNDREEVRQAKLEPLVYTFWFVVVVLMMRLTLTLLKPTEPKTPSS